MSAPLIVRDREYPFFENILVGEMVRWTRSLGSWLKILPSLKCSVCAEFMNRCTSCGRSLLYLLSESTWMLRGQATWSWLVFPFVPCCLLSLCASSLLCVLVHHSQWDLSSDFFLLHQLDKVTGELQRRVRRARRRGAGLSWHLG